MNTIKLDVYRVVSVENTTPPEGVTEGSWHSYVIKSGNSIMRGKSLGSLKQVTSHAEELAEKINSRNINTWGQKKR